MAQAGSEPLTKNLPEGVVQVSSMPLPPMQFIMEYTDEAVKRGSAPQPPAPILDAYTMFGQPFSSEDCIVASLESQGIRRLYSAKEVDRKRELRKLNHSVTDEYSEYRAQGGWIWLKSPLLVSGSSCLIHV